MKHIYIGTAGYYYKWWHNYYYDIPVKNYLEYYSNDFNSVEINNTFYRFPTEKMISNFEQILLKNKNFIFSIKMNQYITHYTKLLHIKKYLDQFFKILEPIKNNTHCILFQFSKNFRYSDQIYDRFINLSIIYRDLMKKNKINKNTRFVFEFRNETFFNEKLINLFKKNKFVFVIRHLYQDDFKKIFNSQLIVSDILYIRLHGTQGLYFGLYNNDQLKLLAKFIKKSLVKRAYIYFNNVDVDIQAINNAKYLEYLLFFTRSSSR